MTSFLATTFAILAHQPETVCAVLGTSRQVMNSSAVPVTLSSDGTWDLFCTYKPETERKLLQLFSTFSDTMQFTEKLRIQNRIDGEFIKSIFENLTKKRYFSRTLRLLELPFASSLIKACRSHDHSSTSRRATRIVFSNLRSLSIEGYSALQNGQLKGICSLCPFLENLNIPGQVELTDEGVESLPNLKHLKTLDLQYCSSITDNGLQHIAKISSLQSLNLKDCTLITDSGLQHLAKLSSLKSMSLYFCRKISDNGLKHLASLCSLETLDLTWCQLITDSGIQHLAKLPCLQSLNLTCCREITDTGLEHIAKLPSLQSLHVGGCSKINDGGCRVFCASTKVFR